MDQTQLIFSVYAAWRVQRGRKRRRREYVRPIFLNRLCYGEQFLISELRLDPLYHHRYFRMNAEMFDELLTMISPKLEHSPNHILPINPLERLAVTLRYLATGNSQVSLSFAFRISPSAISKLLHETLAAICEVLEPIYLKEPTEETWKENSSQFEQKWNFPHCCGSIDGKHVRMKCPGGSGSSFFNYKSYFSLVLFAIADANYRFVAVDIGREGSQSDGGILRRSPINKYFESPDEYFPAPKALFRGHEFPHVIVGDDAFPLKKNLMRPFPGKTLQKDQKVYNYRLSRARMVVENAFGILAARFRIFHSRIEANPILVRLVVRASVVIHNFLLSKNDYQRITVDCERNGEIIPGNWREIVANDDGIIPILRQGSNNSKNDAVAIRNGFKEYFNSPEGSLSWQDSYVLRGS